MYRDAGISGSKGRDQRPGFDAMHKDAARRRFNVVMVWSVDQLGRSLQDLCGFLSELLSLTFGVQLRLGAFPQGLQRRGGSRAATYRSRRWSEGNSNTLRRHATDLVAFAPDAILAGTGGTAGSPDPRRGALILNRRVPDRLASISPWLAAQATSNT